MGWFKSKIKHFRLYQFLNTTVLELVQFICLSSLQVKTFIYIERKKEEKLKHHLNLLRNIYANMKT